MTDTEPETPDPLVDGHGRAHTDLRISVTDRCNLRCTYCMPAEGVEFRSHTDIMSYEEIERFVRVAVRLGIRKLRLTGGEPLVRKGIVGLVEMLSVVPGIDDLAMTTNGVLLSRYAGALKSAGLMRLNISLDTLDRARFEQITRRDELAGVLEGISAARRAGFENIKLNALAMRGVSEDDVAPLARFAREHRLELRFIEFMPLDGDRRWNRADVLSGQEILDLLCDRIGPLEPVSAVASPAPAAEYRFADGGGRIGVIPSVTRPFCQNCDRLRLTADGKVRNCLFCARSWNAAALLRSGGTDEDLGKLIRAAVAEKKKAHGTDDGRFIPSDRPMHQIGG